MPSKGKSAKSNFHFMCLNIRGYTDPADWEKVQALPNFEKLDAILLTEHHLSGKKRPIEIVKSGWNIHFAAGPPKRGSSQHVHRGGIALLTRNTSQFTVSTTIHADHSTESDHQAATWTLISPLYAQKIHITGAYVSPNGSGTAELFTLLAQQPAFPADEVHLYAGDWNAHTASRMESHLTSSDNLPIRVGDEHDASPQHADLTGESVTAAHRGRLLLRLLGTLGHIILNGRFEHPGSDSASAR